MRVVVTGSTGLIGQALLATLGAGGHETVALVRRAGGPGEARWDPAGGMIDTGALAGADAVVHLAGAGIGDRRWTGARRAVILGSRVESTSLLCGALAGLDRPPAVLVSASAIGYYGDRGDEELTETSGPGTGFQAEVCRQWEGATIVAEEAGIRVVHLRSAVVLARTGGALAKQLPLFRAGLGGRLGRGNQWLSWITLRDEVGAILHVLDTASLARALGRPAVLAVPPFALRLALGRDLADELLLGSLKVMPARLEETGYRFRDPHLGDALVGLVSAR